jgi:hypothetical protein
MEDYEVIMLREQETHKKYSISVGDIVTVQTIMGAYTGTVVDIEWPEEGLGIIGTTFCVQDKYHIADSYYHVEEHFTSDYFCMWYNIYDDKGKVKGRIYK